MNKIYSLAMFIMKCSDIARDINLKLHIKSIIIMMIIIIIINLIHSFTTIYIHMCEYVCV